MKPIDLTGHKYGRWTVISKAGHQAKADGKKSATTWNCKCECGGLGVINGNSLRVGGSKSCGCYHKEQARAANIIHGKASGWNGSKKESKTYVSWRAAKERCFNHKHISFANYGGRGIKMCDAWSDNFSTFLQDMGDCPPNGTLDRIDSNGNYEPGNCRWATPAQQSRNTKRNVWMEVDGVRMVAKDAAKLLGVGYCGMLRRMKQSETKAAS